MEQALENIVVYSLVILLCGGIIYLYLRRKKKESDRVDQKIRIAKETGMHEPVSLHPYVDINSCIATGACIAACPEKDILGIRNGKATIINASQCIGHGACFHACPTEAISLKIGTEKRGVDLPHVNKTFETNVPGIFIAGELGGMGLIRNAVEQGKQATENLVHAARRKSQASYELIIVGAGPAGISAALSAKKYSLRFLILEQDTLGGAVFTYPRSKIVMTSPMDLPLYGKIKLFETTKTELLSLWQSLLKKHEINLRENTKVETITKSGEYFTIVTTSGEQITTNTVLLAIGRRGSPRKLNIPGEMKEKVAYRLLDGEEITGKKIMVVGGGDSAVESALLLSGKNNVILSYRNEVFNRIKPANAQALEEAAAKSKLELRQGTHLIEIQDSHVILALSDGGKAEMIPNDLVYIFAGGELPVNFLEKAGITITRKFGETVLKHSSN